MSLQCPSCKSRMKCWDSRPDKKNNEIKRRYRCLQCNVSMITQEVITDFKTPPVQKAKGVG